MGVLLNERRLRWRWTFVITITLVVLAGTVPVASGGHPGSASLNPRAAKKCKKGEVRRHGKCVKKHSVSGPQIPAGTYACNASPGGYGAYGVVKIIAGNQYTVSGGKVGRYTYNPQVKIINFKTGDYVGFYAIYSSKTIEVRASYSDEYIEKGDWLWSCYR